MPGCGASTEQGAATWTRGADAEACGGAAGFDGDGHEAGRGEACGASQGGGGASWVRRLGARPARHTSTEDAVDEPAGGQSRRGRAGRDINAEGCRYKRR